jgi:protein-disulfide isomerase
VILCSAQLFASDGGCTAFSDQLSFHVTEYLFHRIVSQTGGTPSILSAALVPGTCYRKLLIQVSGTSNPMTLYLSPDQRFLTSTLYDLAKDPEEDAAQIASNVQRLLMRDESPHMSSRDAHVTLVEFGDLQCPYCRRFSDWYRALPPELTSGTVLVFKHLPLPMHSWAELAAEYSACASRQSAGAFWELVNYFLSHQDEITPANVKNKIALALPRASTSAVQEIGSCVAAGAGADVVARDVAVAKELAVSSTPTLYIDGRRAPYPHSEEDLRQLLERELSAQSEHWASSGR